MGSDSLNRSSSVRSDSPNTATLDRSTSGATDEVFIQPLGKPDGQTHPPGRPCRRLLVAGHPILQQAYDKYAYDATPPRDAGSVSAFSGVAIFSGLARRVRASRGRRGSLPWCPRLQTIERPRRDCGARSTLRIPLPPAPRWQVRG